MQKILDLVYSSKIGLMKKMFLVLVLFPLGLIAQAAIEPAYIAIQQEATQIARSLVQPLQLNELEYIQVRELAAQHILALNDIADYYRYDEEMLQKKTEAAKQTYDRKLKYILNSTQLGNYLALQNEK